MAGLGPDIWMRDFQRKSIFNFSPSVLSKVEQTNKRDQEAERKRILNSWAVSNNFHHIIKHNSEFGEISNPY